MIGIYMVHYENTAPIRMVVGKTIMLCSKLKWVFTHEKRKLKSIVIDQVRIGHLVELIGWVSYWYVANMIIEMQYILIWALKEVTSEMDNNNINKIKLFVVDNGVLSICMHNDSSPLIWIWIK